MKRKKSKSMFVDLLVLIVLIAGSPATAGTPAPNDITGHHVLNNGLEIQLLPIASTPMVAALVLVKTGYASEKTTNSGYTHLLEHLIFAGTQKRTGKEVIFKEVQDLGGYLNGYTRDDYAGYLVVGHRDHLEQYLELLSDILFNSTISEKAVAEAREVVLEEILRQDSVPGPRTEKVFQSLLYEDSSYERTGLGNRLTVSGVTRDEIIDHYRRTFQPNNMVLLLAGGFPEGSSLKSIENTLGKAVIGSENGKIPPAPSLVGQRVNLIRTDLPDVRVKIGFAGPDPKSPDAMALELLAAVLGGPEGLLETALEGAGMMPRSVSAYLTVNRGFSRFVISATLPKDSDPQGALQVLLDTFPAVLDVGLPPEKVSQARDAMVAGEVMGREKIHYYLMGKAAWALAGGTGHAFSLGRWDHLEPEDLARVGQAYLLSRPYTALLAVPGTQGQEHAGEVTDAHRAMATLDNGLTVVAEQRPDSEVFALHLMTRHRSSLEPEGKEGIADLLFRMLPEGTFEKSRDQIREKFRKLGISFSTAGNPMSPFGDFYTSRTYSYARLECTRDKAGAAVQLFADIFTNPLLPEDRLEEVRSRVLDYISYKKASPGKVASAALAGELYGGVLSPDVLGTAESISSISREDLQGFYRSYVTGRNLIVSVVSGLPPQEALDLIESVLTRLPAGEKNPEPILPDTEDSFLLEIDLEKPQGALALGAVTGTVSRDEEPALTIVAGLLNHRLGKEVREKEGLAYSVGSSLGTVYGRSVFTLSMGTAPEKMERARQSVREQISAVRRMKVTPDELERRINAITGRLQMRMMSSINRAYYLGLAQKSDLDHTFGEDYRKILFVLTPEDVEKAVENYLPEDTFIEVVVKNPDPEN
ncbi:insulinase family protein [bacterium]|nr:MAG: insulinase family protein [bacterium]